MHIMQNAHMVLHRIRENPPSSSCPASSDRFVTTPSGHEVDGALLLANLDQHAFHLVRNLFKSPRTASARGQQHRTPSC